VEQWAQTFGIYYNKVHLTGASNLAGYLCWGKHSSLWNDYPTNSAKVAWTGEKKWWLIQTIESYNGQRQSDQGHVLQWFSPNAFGGSNYSNTPIGAISSVDEPAFEGFGRSFYILATMGGREAVWNVRVVLGAQRKISDCRGSAGAQIERRVL
jgi:hypothetical protein